MGTSTAKTAGGEQTGGEVETIDLNDPHHMDKAFDIYAHFRERGPVSKVMFTAGVNTERGGAFDFLGKESHFVTHYDEVVSALMDGRLGTDPKRALTEEQLKKIPPVPEETARVARAAFPKGTALLRIRDELGVIYRDDMFASLFPKRGQPATAPRLGLRFPVCRRLV